MPVTIEQIPRDSSGIVVGLFRLRHRDPRFSEALGPVVFSAGVTTEPLTGPVLERLVANLGEDLDLEPWNPPPRALAPAPAPVPAPIPPRPSIEPPLPAPRPATGGQAPDDELPNDKDALLALAAARGIPVNAAWSAKAMRQAIRAHHKRFKETHDVD